MKYTAAVLALIISFPSGAQIIKSDYFMCKDSYVQIEKLISEFSELRDSMAAISPDKKAYLEGLRWKVLNGSLSERKVLSQSYYNDPDYPIFSLITSINFIINDAINFRGKKRWEDDRDLLDKAVNGSLTVASNGYLNNPYQNMMRLIELSREISLFLEEYSRTTADLKARGQLYKIRNHEYFSSGTSNYQFTYTNISFCHLYYLQNKTVEREINR